MAHAEAVGLVLRNRKGKPMAGPEGPPPRDETIARSVYLSPQLWDALKKTADFHTRFFKARGLDQVASRNDMIDSFLRWAVEEYWIDKGGEPTSEREMDEKADRHAEKMKAQNKQASRK